MHLFDIASLKGHNGRWAYLITRWISVLLCSMSHTVLRMMQERGTPDEKNFPYPFQSVERTPTSRSAGHGHRTADRSSVESRHRLYPGGTQGVRPRWAPAARCDDTG